MCKRLLHWQEQWQRHLGALSLEGLDEERWLAGLEELWVQRQSLAERPMDFAPGGAGERL